MFQNRIKIYYRHSYGPTKTKKVLENGYEHGPKTLRSVHLSVIYFQTLTLNRFKMTQKDMVKEVDAHAKDIRTKVICISTGDHSLSIYQQKAFTYFSYSILKVMCPSLTLYQTILTFNDHETEGFLKHCGKRRKCW